MNYLDVKAYAHHERLRKYKKEKFNQDYGYIGGAGIVYLYKAGPPWIKYDLGITEEDHNLKLEQIKTVIEKDVFNFFEEFTQIEKIINHYGEPCFDLRNATKLI